MKRKSSENKKMFKIFNILFSLLFAGCHQQEKVIEIYYKKVNLPINFMDPIGGYFFIVFFKKILEKTLFINMKKRLKKMRNFIFLLFFFILCL